MITAIKRFVATAGLVLLFAPFASAGSRRSILARVTVYWASGRGSDSYTRRHQCSTGVRLRTGHCAVDPRKIPYGSKVVLPDGTLTAVDTGTDVVNRRASRGSGRSFHERHSLVIDRFFETRWQALAWASSHAEFMMVQIIPPTRNLTRPQKSALWAFPHEKLPSQNLHPKTIHPVRAPTDGRSPSRSINSPWSGLSFPKPKI